MMKNFMRTQTAAILSIGLLFIVSSCDRKKEQSTDLEKKATGANSTQKVIQDWPLFRRDAEMQGVSMEDMKAPLKLVWQFLPPDLVEKGKEGDAGKKEASKATKKKKRGRPFQATAVIVDGLVYVGSQEGRFFCLDLKDGKMQWEFKSEGLISGSAAVIGDKVVFGCQYGFLYGLDKKSGEQLWRFETDDKIEGGVNALEMKDPETGKEQTRLFFGSYDNHLYAVDAATGKLIWKYETDNYLVATPSVVGGDEPSVIVGGCDGLLHVISAATGKELRNFEVGAYIPNSAGVRDGIAYVAHFGGEIGAYDVNAGEEVWKVVAGTGVELYASPAVSRKYVYVGARDKTLRCLDRMDGKEVWRFTGRKDMDSSAVVCESALYAGGMDGRLYALDPQSGKELWSYEIGANISSSPAISNGTLVICGEDGVVYAFREAGSD